MHKYETKIRGAASAVPAVRQALLLFSKRCGFSGEELNDIESAVGEALANAAEHGSRAGGTIVVRAAMNGDELSVEIRDGGDGFERWNTNDIIKPPSGSPRGYGIFLMRGFMDEVAYTDHGRSLRLVKRRRAAAVQENEDLAL